MDQNEYNNALTEYISEIKKLEVQAKQQGNTQVECSTEELKKLIKFDKIPKDLGEWYLIYIDQENRKFKEWQQFIHDNPNMSPHDQTMQFHGLPKTLEPKDVLKLYERAVNLGKIHNYILANKGINLPEQNENHSLPPQFFKTVGPDEFGMSRLIADPLNNVPKMLGKFNPPVQIQDNIYILQANCNNSHGDIVSLEYRFRAPSQEEANKQAHEFERRIKGRQKKAYEACWALANKRNSRVITCDLTELMSVAYPDRKSNESYSVADRAEFFQDLFDISQTQITITKKTKAGKKGNEINKFILPLITINGSSDYNMTSNKKSETYPNKISFSVLYNPLYKEEIMYSVGAGIKQKTLELSHEDLPLAEYIQIRKSQLMNKNYIVFEDRESLLKLANLDGIKHSGMANKRLLGKFGRLQEKGIIVFYPNRVTFPFTVKIR